MKRISSILNLAVLMLASSPAWGAEPGELPIRFGAPGAKVSVRLRDAGDGPVVLRALGRNWTDPITPREGAIEVELPAVRVPMTFSVVAAGKTEPALARIVVYPPDSRAPWDAKVPLYMAADSPEWLREWLAAIGLPATPVKLGDFPVGAERAAGGAGLLIVGRSAAGKTANEFIERQTQWQINVLVLEADWFGAGSDEAARLGADPEERFHHSLAELNRFAWPQSASFQGVAGPWPGIANRWVWIDGPTSPLVEEVRASGHNRWIVFNYLPWRQQLGVETADAIFLAILKEAAQNSSAAEPLDREFVLAWPAAEMISATTRPVLAACLRERQNRPEATTRGETSATPESTLRKPPLSILDLRGPALSANDAAALPAVSPKRDWLVLGTDPGVVLPDQERVKEIQDAGTVKKSRVIHLQEDVLPASTKGQVRLMQVLTDQGVSIGKLKIRRDP
jgi:hypothetical protein